MEYVRKLSIYQLANIIQSNTIYILAGETWGYKINLVNKCGTASLSYFKNKAATGDLLQHYIYLRPNHLVQHNNKLKKLAYLGLFSYLHRWSLIGAFLNSEG